MPPKSCPRAPVIKPVVPVEAADSPRARPKDAEAATGAAILHMSYVVRTNNIVDTYSVNMNTTTLHPSLSRTRRQEKSS